MFSLPRQFVYNFAHEYQGSDMSKIEADVVVIGAGNAAFCAALAAQEHGASVCMFERAPKEECGGNSRFLSLIHI